ncbi:MAG: hypothetical protein K5866_08545 [Treponema sp.]|nr:hypothetical protein [Treponema sp.]
MRKIYSFILFLLFSSNLFAASGALWGEKNLKMISSEWFDIVYPESCEESAKILYENADDIYRDIAKMYKMDIPCRLPVTITSSVELYNAYYTSQYYNHIVLYASYPIESCNVESDNLLKTFKHELTHNFTYNLKSDLWKSIDKVFGDSINPSFMLVTSGMAEGATVTAESADGEGRLNNEFEKQSVKQAKIEGKFPKFNDVQGARDIYPSGSFYYFNGAFHQWLQDKYGLEKYAQWWFDCVNFKSITIRNSFKKVYGFKLVNAWQMFAFDYKVPSVPANPMETGLVQDFFTSGDESKYNKMGALAESLSISQKGITYIDSKTSALYFIPNESSKKSIKPKKILSQSYLSQARQSADGNYIAINYYTDYTGSERYRVSIYNTQTKKSYTVKESGLTEASIIKSGNDYYLTAVKYQGEDWKIRITKLIFSGNKIIGEEEAVYIPYTRLQTPAYFVDCLDGTFAYVLRDKLEHFICRADLAGKELSRIPLPYKRMDVRYLSYSEGKLYFSWVKPGTMPRLGSYNLAENTFALSDQDFSGGVFYPVKKADKIVYIGNFYTSNKILTMDDLTLEPSPIDTSDESYLEEYVWKLEGVEEVGTVKENQEESAESAEKESDFYQKAKKYNQFKFLKRGLLIPLGLMNSVSYDPYHSENTYSLPIGVSYYTSDPWGGNNYYITSGYSPSTNSAGLELLYKSGSHTSVLNYSVSGNAEFDRYGWKQSTAKAEVLSSFAFGRISGLTIQPTALFHIGRASASKSEAENRLATLASTESEVLGLFGGMFGAYESYDMTNYIYSENQLILYYSNFHKQDPSRMSKFGILVGLVPYYVYNATLDKSEIYYNGGDLSFFTQAYIPKLIPINCVENFTYNMPTKVLAGIFSADKVASSLSYAYEFPTFAFINFETVLFGCEIQKSIDLLPFLYLYDLRVTLNGTFGADYNSSTKSDTWRFLQLQKYIEEIADNDFNPKSSISLKLDLGFCPTNFGGLCGGIKEYAYIAGHLINENSTSYFNFTFGFDVKF